MQYLKFLTSKENWGDYYKFRTCRPTEIVILSNVFGDKKFSEETLKKLCYIISNKKTPEEIDSILFDIKNDKRGARSLFGPKGNEFK